MSLRIRPSSIAGHAHRRSESRARVPMEAKVDTLHGRNSAFILNLSCNGAMVQSQELPGVGTSVVLRCGSIDALAAVVWVEHERFGVQFDEPIPEEIVIQMRREAEEAARSATHRGDRRPNFSSGPISVTEWKTAQEWARSNSWR
jgi:hypothetical protein